MRAVNLLGWFLFALLMVFYLPFVLFLELAALESGKRTRNKVAPKGTFLQNIYHK